MYDEYREEIVEINKEIELFVKEHPKMYAFYDKFYILGEKWQYQIRGFSKELGKYVKTLPTDLIEKIDTKEFKCPDEWCWTYGDEDSGWYCWGAKDEIITTFGYYYQINNNFEEASKKTLEFYNSSTVDDWREGRSIFLERLLLS